MGEMLVNLQCSCPSTVRIHPRQEVEPVLALEAKGGLAQGREEMGIVWNC